MVVKTLVENVEVIGTGGKQVILVHDDSISNARKSLFIYSKINYILGLTEGKRII